MNDLESQKQFWRMEMEISIALINFNTEQAKRENNLGGWTCDWNEGVGLYMKRYNSAKQKLEEALFS